MAEYCVSRWRHAGCDCGAATTHWQKFIGVETAPAVLQFLLLFNVTMMLYHQIDLDSMGCRHHCEPAILTKALAVSVGYREQEVLANEVK